MLNEWKLIGRIGSFNVQNYSDGKRIFLSLAEQANYFDEDKQEWVERTRWHDLTSWQPELIDRITSTYKVGDLVYVAGLLEPWRKKKEHGSYEGGVNLKIRTFRLLAHAKKEGQGQTEPEPQGYDDEIPY
ncbi:MAG: single-stranded DNA-binding protein [Bifidobacterium asteroides]